MYQLISYAHHIIWYAYDKQKRVTYCSILALYQFDQYLFMLISMLMVCWPTMVMFFFMEQKLCIKILTFHQARFVLTVYFQVLSFSWHILQLYNIVSTTRCILIYFWCNNLLIFSIPRIICRFSDWRKLKVNWVNFLNCFQSAFLYERFPVNSPEGRGHPLNAVLFGRNLLVLKNLTVYKCCQNLSRYSCKEYNLSFKLCSWNITIFRLFLLRRKQYFHSSVHC